MVNTDTTHINRHFGGSQKILSVNGLETEISENCCLKKSFPSNSSYYTYFLLNHTFDIFILKSGKNFTNFHVFK